MVTHNPHQALAIVPAGDQNQLNHSADRPILSLDNQNSGPLVKLVQWVNRDAMAITRDNEAHRREKSIANIISVMDLNEETLRDKKSVPSPDINSLNDASSSMKIPAWVNAGIVGMVGAALGSDVSDQAFFSLLAASIGGILPAWLAYKTTKSIERNTALKVMSDEFINTPAMKLYDGIELTDVEKEQYRRERELADNAPLKKPGTLKVVPSQRLYLTLVMSVFITLGGLPALKKSTVRDMLREEVKAELLAKNSDYVHDITERNRIEAEIARLKTQSIVPDDILAKDQQRKDIARAERSLNNEKDAIEKKEDEKMREQGFMDYVRKIPTLVMNNPVPVGLAVWLHAALDLIGLAGIWRNRRAKKRYNAAEKNKTNEADNNHKTKSLELQKAANQLKIIEILQDAQHELEEAYASTGTDDQKPLGQMMKDMAAMMIDTDRRTDWGGDIARLQHQLSKLKHEYHEDADIMEHLQKVTEHLNALRDIRLVADESVEQHRAHARGHVAEEEMNRSKAEEDHETQELGRRLSFEAAERLFDRFNDLQTRGTATAEWINATIREAQRDSAIAHLMKFDPARYSGVDLSGYTTGQILNMIGDLTLEQQARQEIVSLGAVNSGNALKKALQLRMEVLRQGLTL